MATRKKVITISIAAAICACIFAITSFADDTPVIFGVDGVGIVGCVYGFDSTGGNPFDSDYVTAITSATALMDFLRTKATLYYMDNGKVKSSSVEQTNASSDSCEATVSVYTWATGFKGEGTHTASRHEKSNTATTYVEW